MTTPHGIRSDGHYKAAVDSGTVIALGDMVFLDTDDVKPAASQADQGSEGANQRRFAKVFAGMAASAKTADQTYISEVLIDADPTKEWDFDCVSEAHEVGDFLAPDEQSGGTALENQKLVKVTNEADATHRCVRRDASAASKVRVVMHRSILWGRDKDDRGQVQALGTVTATQTLDALCGDIITMAPSGASRKLLLPPESGAIGRRLMVINTGNQDIDVRDDGDGSTICTISQNERGWVVCDGTSWYGATGAQT